MKVKNKLLKILPKLLLVAIVVGYIISSFYLLTNLFSINENTINLHKDFSAYKVEYIGSDDTIYLENGASIGSDEITSYVKVNRGSGTWYINDDSLLVVEVVFSDIFNMLVGYVAYMVVILILISFLIKRGLKGIRYKYCFLIIPIVGFIISWSFVWFYLVKVLNIG